MKTIYLRFMAETPGFFKKLRNISIAIATASGAAIVTYSQLPANVTGFVPAQWLKYLALASMVAGFVSQLTRVDTPTT